MSGRALPGPMIWPCPLPGGGQASEWAIATQTGAALRLLIVPALFEEANRLRRLAMGVMRQLALAGVDCCLPDLPGCNESLAALDLQTPGDWQLAMEGAARHFEATHVLALRGGALVAPRGLPGWHYAPTTGAAQLKQMLRARVLWAREAGREESVESLLTLGREQGLELAGYTLSADFLSEMQGLVVRKHENIVTVDQSMLPGAGLWLRAEPGDDPQQSLTLAALINAGMRAGADDEAPSGKPSTGKPEARR